MYRWLLDVVQLKSIHRFKRSCSDPAAQVAAVSAGNSETK